MGLPVTAPSFGVRLNGFPPDRRGIDPTVARIPGRTPINGSAEDPPPGIRLTGFPPDRRGIDPTVARLPGPNPINGITGYRTVVWNPFERISAGSPWD